MNTVRWKQRFANLEKAYRQFENATHRDQYDELSTAGLVQMFEFTFELVWKTFKDYLEHNGYDEESPRNVIKRCYQLGYLEDGELWLEALEKRNVLAHVYDESFAKEAIKLINGKYFSMISQAFSFLSKAE